MKQYVVDAFTDTLFKGNPAAICVLERWLPETLMMSIALENNFSETAFAVKEGESYRLRWFTSGGEIDLCGHATLAAAFVILNFYEKDCGQVIFQSISGQLTVCRRGDLYEMDFPAYELKPVLVTEQIVSAIGARPREAYMGRDLLCVFEDAREGAGLRFQNICPQMRRCGGCGLWLRPLSHCSLLGQPPGKT